MKDAGEMKGKLGLWTVVFLASGGMIGSAVFSLSGATAIMTGPSTVLAWALAGILMLLVAINFAELSTAFPRIGGIAQYPLETLGPNRGIRAFAGYVAGWCWAWTELIGAAFSTVVMYQFLGVPLMPWGIVIAVVILLATYVINVMGIQPTAKVNFIMFIGLALTMLIYFFMGVGSISGSNFQPFFATGASGFLSAIPIAALGFGAWIVITSLAAEIREPKKTIPKAIIFSLVITIVLYSVMILVTVGTVPAAAWTPDNQFAMFAGPNFAATMFAPGSTFIDVIIKIAAVLALLTTAVALFADASRVFAALGQTGLLPSFLGKINPRTKTPVNSLTFVGVFGLVLAIFFSDRLLEIISLGAVYLSLAFLIGLLAAIGLKVFRKDIKPEFRAPGGILAPIIGVAALGFLIWNVFTTTFTAWGAASLYILSGVGLVYFIVIAVTKTGIFSPKSTVGRLEKK